MALFTSIVHGRPDTVGIRFVDRMMHRLLRIMVVGLVATLPAVGSAAARRHARSAVDVTEPISGRASDYSNGYGTNAANSAAVGGSVGPYGGYVVNQYGYGNYVSGPGGYGGYPAGSAGAQIWRQREQWKCQSVPESC